MTDPLLTIDDATRAFRTSPKTIRRRLAAGEIAGAYKRPGSRGPEWVMPEQSLLAAGFARRAGVATGTLPDDPAERAVYWERRAVDAEAAVRAAAGGAPTQRRTSVRVPVLVAGALALIVLAFVAGRLTAGASDAGAPETDATGSVRSVLAARTTVGDAVGLLGPVPAAAIPEGREVVRLEDLRSPGSSGARYVMVAAGGRRLRAGVDDLESSAELLLTVPTGAAGGLRVYDAGLRDAADSVAPASTVDRPTASASSDPSAPADSAPVPSLSGEASDGPAADSLGPANGREPPASAVIQTVAVEVGDSFWSIASDAAAAGGVDVVQYWSALVDLNMDRLVEPGNPDLLHVGQTLRLPPPA